MRAAASLLIVVGPGLAVLGVGKDLQGLACGSPDVPVPSPYLSSSALPAPQLGMPWGLQSECILLPILT